LIDLLLNSKEHGHQIFWMNCRLGLIAGMEQEGFTVLDVAEVARILRKSPYWVRRHAVELGGKRFGSSILFTLENLKKALALCRRQD